jgi:hypothetical protein
VDQRSGKGGGSPGEDGAVCGGVGAVDSKAVQPVKTKAVEAMGTEERIQAMASVATSMVL